jgi:hypothetical protein
MIRILGISLILIFTASVSAQQKNIKVPEKVSEAFQISHPKAEDVAWDKEGSKYEANYKENGKSCSVLINDLGKTIETESEIEIPELPSGVIKYISDNYRGYIITGASKIISEGGSVQYEAEIKKGKTSEDLLFDHSGKPLKQ